MWKELFQFSQENARLEAIHSQGETQQIKIRLPLTLAKLSQKNFFEIIKDHQDVPKERSGPWRAACSTATPCPGRSQVPTLFSNRLDGARDALDAEPERAWANLSKTLRKFAKQENVPPAAGWGVILKSRLLNTNLCSPQVLWFIPPGNGNAIKNSNSSLQRGGGYPPLQEGGLRGPTRQERPAPSIEDPNRGDV
jgi:hypothetical protein